MTLTRMCYFLNLLSHIGFNVDSLRTYDINMIIYKDPKDTMMRITTGYDTNDYEGFMTC